MVPQGTLARMIFIIQEYYPMFLEGIRYTIIISIIGTLFGVLIGMVLVSMKLLQVGERDGFGLRVIKKILNSISIVYVDVIRGTPMMIQAIILYYGFLFPVFRMGFLGAGLFIVSINTAAYATEVLRGSIQAIDPGQMEAARSLGMTNRQAMVKVILPQALRNSIPAIGNELVINIKDSSVLSVIGVVELMYQSRAAASQYFLHVESALVAAVIYLVLTMTATRLLEYFVKRSSGSGSDSGPTKLKRTARNKRMYVSIPTSQSFSKGDVR